MFSNVPTIKAAKENRTLSRSQIWFEIARIRNAQAKDWVDYPKPRWLAVKKYWRALHKGCLHAD